MRTDVHWTGSRDPHRVTLHAFPRRRTRRIAREARADKAAAIDAWDAFCARQREPDDDWRAKQAALAIEYAMYGLLWQGWKQRLPISISF